jgi:hypothetical protein
MGIPTEVLTASGHPPRRTRALVSAFDEGAGGEVFGLEDIREFRDIRQYCLACVEGEAEVRRCTTINCPFWPYRMGRNPHSLRRGINPFAKGNTARGSNTVIDINDRLTSRDSPHNCRWATPSEQKRNQRPRRRKSCLKAEEV